MRHVRNTFYSYSFLDMGSKDASVFVAGAGRSGTTWLADFLSHVFGCRFVFEPFWQLHLSVNGEADFFHHLYLDPKDDSHDETIRKVVEGRYRKPCANYNHRIGVCRGRIVKDICANLFLHRIQAVAPRMPIIYIRRHPCSVVLSRKRVGDWTKNWGRHAHVFLKQPKLVEVLREKVAPYLDKDMSEVEDYALTACLENYFPSQLLGQSPKMRGVFYESLVLDFGPTVEGLVEFIRAETGMPIVRGVNQVKNYFQLCHPETRKLLSSDARSHLVSWEKELTADEIKTVTNLFDQFGLSYYRDINAYLEQKK